MTRALLISVRFLDPRFHGRGDSDSPEWPPSPARLFQALIRASHTGSRGRRWMPTGENCQLRAAFLWLEGLQPPQIIAPPAQPVDGYVFFPPRNDADDPQTFERQDRLSRIQVRPHVFGGPGDDGSDESSVHFLWEITEGEWTEVGAHAATLIEEARHLTALGWGIDQVVGDGAIVSESETADLQGERWSPHYGILAGGVQLRVPTAGALDDLERVHRELIDRVRVRSPFSRFEKVSYLLDGILPPRPYAVFELDEEAVPFRQENAVHVAAMLRSLVCRPPNRRDFSEQFDDDTAVCLAGHVGRSRNTIPRFSYIPIPTMGHRHADGRIRRLLIAEPAGGDGTRSQWATQRLTSQYLVDHNGEIRGQLQSLWRRSSPDMVERYVAEHRRWSTVTPVVLPGFDDGKLDRAEKLLFRALEQADINPDFISKIRMRKAPFWAGSSHPGNYTVAGYLKGLPTWHVALEFSRRVPGPLAIGAGRYSGLGLMAGAE